MLIIDRKCSHESTPKAAATVAGLVSLHSVELWCNLLSLFFLIPSVVQNLPIHAFEFVEDTETVKLNLSEWSPNWICKNFHRATTPQEARTPWHTKCSALGALIRLGYVMRHFPRLPLYCSSGSLLYRREQQHLANSVSKHFPGVLSTLVRIQTLYSRSIATSFQALVKTITSFNVLPLSHHSPGVVSSKLSTMCKSSETWKCYIVIFQLNCQPGQYWGKRIWNSSLSLLFASLLVQISSAHVTKKKERKKETRYWCQPLLTAKWYTSVDRSWLDPLRHKPKFDMCRHISTNFWSSNGGGSCEIEVCETLTKLTSMKCRDSK